MNILVLFIFVLVSAECVSRFFYSRARGICPMALLVFVALFPTAISALSKSGSSWNSHLSSDFAALCLGAISPLIVAALVFSLLQALLSMSISKDFSTLLRIFRPVWLVGFVIAAIRNITPIASAILIGTGQNHE